MCFYVFSVAKNSASAILVPSNVHCEVHFHAWWDYASLPVESLWVVPCCLHTVLLSLAAVCSSRSYIAFISSSQAPSMTLKPKAMASKKARLSEALTAPDLAHSAESAFVDPPISMSVDGALDATPSNVEEEQPAEDETKPEENRLGVLEEGKQVKEETPETGSNDANDGDRGAQEHVNGHQAGTKIEENNETHNVNVRNAFNLPSCAPKDAEAADAENKGTGSVVAPTGDPHTREEGEETHPHTREEGEKHTRTGNPYDAKPEFLTPLKSLEQRQTRLLHRQGSHPDAPEKKACKTDTFVVPQEKLKAKQLSEFTTSGATVSGGGALTPAAICTDLNAEESTAHPCLQVRIDQLTQTVQDAASRGNFVEAARLQAQLEVLRHQLKTRQLPAEAVLAPAAFCPVQSAEESAEVHMEELTQKLSDAANRKDYKEAARLQDELQVLQEQPKTRQRLAEAALAPAALCPVQSAEESAADPCLSLVHIDELTQTLNDAVKRLEFTEAARLQADLKVLQEQLKTRQRLAKAALAPAAVRAVQSAEESAADPCSQVHIDELTQTLNDAVKRREFTEAGRLQAELKVLQEQFKTRQCPAEPVLGDRLLELQRELAQAVESKDYSKAAEVQANVKRAQAQLQENQRKKRRTRLQGLSAMLTKATDIHDYGKAIDIKKDMEALKDMEFQDDGALQEVIALQESTRTGINEDVALQEDMDQRDIRRVFALQEDMEQREIRRLHINDLESSRAKAVVNEDFARAARIHTELTAMKEEFEGDSKVTTHPSNVGSTNTISPPCNEGVLVSIPSLWSKTSPMFETVRLEAVQVLSLSKPGTVPVNAKGKSKDRSKDKGKVKSKGGSKDKGKSQDKGKSGGVVEPIQVLYVGRDGHSVALVASGPLVSNLPATVGGWVNITALKPRAAVQGLLNLSEATQITPSCSDACVSPYASIIPTASFATHKYAKECDVGEFVDLVVWVQSRTEKATFQKAEPFLELHCIDMDGHSIGPLRMWRYVESDMEAQCTYIVRGLKVVLSMHYDAELCKYIVSGDGRKTFECSWRSAVENVSEQSAITSCFV